MAEPRDITEDFAPIPGWYEIRSDKEPTLKELQEFVGGYIERVKLCNGDDMIVNEEGKLIGLKMNVPATTVMLTMCGPDVICGPAMILKGKARLT